MGAERWLPLQGVLELYDGEAVLSVQEVCSLFYSCYPFKYCFCNFGWRCLLSDFQTMALLMPKLASHAEYLVCASGGSIILSNSFLILNFLALATERRTATCAAWAMW